MTLMKINFKAKYRVVTDNFGGFETQYKPWWSPFWLQCSRMHGGKGYNTNRSLTDAEALARKHATYKLSYKLRKAPSRKVVVELSRFDHDRQCWELNDSL